jgi:hypothetical protein
MALMKIIPLGFAPLPPFIFPIETWLDEMCAVAGKKTIPPTISNQKILSTSIILQHEVN